MRQEACISVLYLLLAPTRDQRREHSSGVVWEYVRRLNITSLADLIWHRGANLLWASCRSPITQDGASDAGCCHDCAKQTFYFCLFICTFSLFSFSPQLLLDMIEIHLFLLVYNPLTYSCFLIPDPCGPSDFLRKNKGHDQNQQPWRKVQGSLMVKATGKTAQALFLSHASENLTWSTWPSNVTMSICLWNWPLS